MSVMADHMSWRFKYFDLDRVSYTCSQVDGTHFCLKVAVTATDKLCCFFLCP